MTTNIRGESESLDSGLMKAAYEAARHIADSYDMTYANADFEQDDALMPVLERVGERHYVFQGIDPQKTMVRVRVLDDRIVVQKESLSMGRHQHGYLVQEMPEESVVLDTILGLQYDLEGDGIFHGNQHERADCDYQNGVISEFVPIPKSWYECFSERC